MDAQQPKFIPFSLNPSAESTRARIADIVRLASTPKPSENVGDLGMENSYNDNFGDEAQDLDEMLYARHTEIQTLEDLTLQRGTNIPALYNQVYKFIQNPSTVSVETFRRMKDTDETIGAGIDFLISCLAARLGKYTHSNDQVSEWMNDRLEQIDSGWTQAIKEILAACWAGFYVGEKVWANTENGFVIKKIVSLPPGTVLFETHRTGELTSDGILQYQRNYNPALFGAGIAYLFGFSSTAVPFTQNNIRPDIYAKLGDYPFPLRSPNIFSYLSIRIPVRKCIHFAWNTNNNPYGLSMLRRAYKHWVLKDAVLQFMAIALDRKGTPLQVWYVDPNATFIDTDKWNGMPIDPTQNVGIRAQTAIKNALRNVHNDSVVIMPGRKAQFVEHDIIQQSSNAQDFIAALNYLDTRIMRALLLPPLVFGSGDGSGSYSLGQEHAKTFDKLCDGFLEPVKMVLIQQLVREMMMLNFPPEVWEKDGFGEFSSRELTQDERQKEMECVAKAIEVGGVDMNDLDDLNRIRELAGFKPRDVAIPQPAPMFGEEEEDEDEGGKPGPDKSGASDGVD